MFEQPSHLMNDNMLEVWVQSYIESQVALGNHHINFIWQGGEPTLCGLDYFQKIITLQQKHKPQNPNIQIENAIQTNGVLITDDWAKFLKEHNFLVGLSIDGNKEMHDAYRKDKRGKGSYDLVVKGLNYLQKYDVATNALCVVNSLNAQQPKQVYRHLVGALGFRFIQFIPCVEPMRQGKNIHVTPWTVRPKLWGQFLTEVCNEWYRANHVQQVYIQLFDLQVGYKFGMESSLCLFKQDCGDALALEHNGDLYACDHFVDDEWRLGNIAKESLSDLAFSAKQTAFGKMKSGTLPRNCHSCPYLTRCWGECPKNRFVPDAKSPYPKAYLCEGWKYFFKNTDDIFTEIATEYARTHRM